MDFRTIQMLDNLWHILIMCHYIIVVSWDQELHFHAYLNSWNLYLWMSCGQKSRNNSERYTETMNMKWTLQMLICKHNMPIYLTWVSWFNESRGVTSIGFRLHHHPGVPVGARARPITVLRMKASKIPGCRTFKNNNWNLDELWEFSELWGTGWVSLVLFEGHPAANGFINQRRVGWPSDITTRKPLLQIATNVLHGRKIFIFPAISCIWRFP